MEKPNAETIARYTALLPADPRVAPGQMFAHPCAFVSGHMFFGTFAQTLIARVGADRAEALLERPSVTVFEPMPGRPWREYVQFAPEALEPAEAATLVADALDYTLGLPAKPQKVPKPKANPAAKR